jgi:membrane protein implicated in regulation of membrane protease activity
MSHLISNAPDHILWLVSGVACLSLGMMVAEPTLSALGIAAVITAIAAFSIPQLGLQLIIWGILSIALALIFRGLVPGESKDLLPSREGRVSVTIPQNGTGEVSYEGSYWTARCQIADLAIVAGQTVHIVGRRGNTLIVLPISFPEDGSVSDRRYD